MPNYTQAPTPLVIDAGLVRLTELAGRFVYLRENHQPTNVVVASMVDLRQKMEALALSASVAEQNMLKGYLQETYGLLAVYTDPLLRPLLPTLSAGGNELVTLVLNVNGYDVVVNGFLVGLGAILRPAIPDYNTDLKPLDKVGSISYNGLADTVLSLDVPVPLLVGASLYLRLFVGAVQAGRVDFPDSILGQGFTLLYGGELYEGVLQITTDNTLLLA